ncbi:MAG: DUF2778 domain-containing protein [Rhodobacteraceae bacterium]|nr:DUF2778 domain-containing protein [Paracoccaceae bacterium]
MQPADPPVSASIEAQKAQETLYQKLQHELQLQMQTAKAELAAGLARLTLKNMLMARMDAAQGSVPEAAPKPDHNTVVAALSDGKSQTQDAPETAAQTALVTASLALDVVPVPSARPQAPRKPVAAGLAYAPAPELQTNKGGIFDGLGKVFKKSGKIELPGKHMGIAVYEISTATVHMPDGTKLEAHSGLGKMKDNPKYVYRKNRGPTPPNVYNLRMRERRYHGVEAIRMLPVDVAAMRGRDGMLTHTSLVRGTNGSHGCVAFKDYNKFLSAFKSGKVKKMIVVPQLDELPTYMASL